MKGIDFDAETFQKSEVLEYLDEWMANPPAGFRRNKPLYDVQTNPNGLTIMFENYKAGRKFTTICGITRLLSEDLAT